jgi:branched-chain amino acid transport system permease protein
VDIGFILQIVVAGLAQGSLYALAALGLVVIYNASYVVNFAQGAMGMAAVYVAWVALNDAHLPYAFAFLGALAFAFVVGVIVQTLLLHRLLEASAMTQVVVTLGLFMFLQGIVGLAFGYNPRSLVPSLTIAPLLLGPVVLRPQDMLALGLLVALGIALATLFNRTKLGTAMRAITQNPFAARLMGIPVGSVLSLAWGIGVSLGAVAALLAAPVTSVTPNMMDTIVVYGFVAAILGGFGSLVGAVVGGLLLGVINNLIDAYLAPELSLTIVFGLLLVVLYVKPDGLFGRTISQKA